MTRCRERRKSPEDKGLPVFQSAKACIALLRNATPVSIILATGLVFVATAPNLFSQAGGSLLGEHSQEQVNERVTRDASGRVTRSVTSRRRAISITERIDETRALDKEGKLQVVERVTERTDLTGASVLTREKRLAEGQPLRVVHRRTVVIGADGASVTTEENLNKHGSLRMTRRVTVSGSRADRKTVDERFDADGGLQSRATSRVENRRNDAGAQVSVKTSQQEARGKDGVMVITSHSTVKTVSETSPDGSVIVTVSQRNQDGQMVPQSRTTTTKELNGSRLVVTERRQADGTWVATSESSTINTHVSGLKLPKVESGNKANMGPQK